MNMIDINRIAVIVLIDVFGKGGLGIAIQSHTVTCAVFYRAVLYDRIAAINQYHFGIWSAIFDHSMGKTALITCPIAEIDIWPWVFAIACGKENLIFFCSICNKLAYIIKTVAYSKIHVGPKFYLHPRLNG